MKNPLQVLNNIQLGKPNSVLVFHHDGFKLSGAIVHAGITGQEIQSMGSSSAIDFSTAIAEVLEQIKTKGNGKVPKKAVLISASAISALIDLPINPENPRSPQQMNELVRWELEPLFAQQNERWSIGALLMGRGYLAQNKRADVMVEVLARNAASNQRMTARFGEVAQSLGLLTREQIDECLALQERLVQFDDDTFCGWVPQKTGDEVDIDNDVPRYPWLASGMADGLRKHWVKACRRNNLFLTAIYPSLGVGFELLQMAERDELYVDLQQEDFVVMRGQPGSLRTYRVETGHDGDISPEQVLGLCHEEMRPDLSRITLNADDDVFASLSTVLADRLEREVVAPDQHHDLGVGSV